MQITYQGEAAQCRDGDTIAAFLSAAGADHAKCVIELDGEILPPGAAEATPLHEGAKLDVFRIVAGG